MNCRAQGQKAAIAITGLLLSFSCHADVWKCSGPNHAVIYTDAACPKGMRSEPIRLENKSSVVIESEQLPNTDPKRMGAQQYSEADKNPGGQLYADMATIKRARQASLEMDQRANAENGKTGNGTRLLSTRKWAYFIRNDEKAAYLKGDK